MSKQIDKLIEHIRELETRLGEVDNNLRYIKVVQALKYSLEKLDNMLKDNTTLQREYQAIYLSYFYTGCGFSFYDRVCNSILDYQYGEQTILRNTIYNKVWNVLVRRSHPKYFHFG